MVVHASDRDSSTSPFQNSHIRSSKATIGSPINKRPIVRRRVLRHMVDVGFVDRVRGRIGIHGVLKGGFIKGEEFTGFSAVQIRVCRGIWGVGSPVGVSVGGCSWEGSVSWVLTALLGGGVDLVVALCFLAP